MERKDFVAVEEPVSDGRVSSDDLRQTTEAVTFELAHVLWEESEDLKVLPEGERIALLTVAIVLCSFCVVGNCAAIFTVFRRKLRLLYKCCLVSLALSDLLLGLSYSATYIPKFVQKYSNAWALGEGMCSFQPLLMAMCLLINSMTISCIALDRYQAVRGGVKKRWDPNLWICLLLMLLIWSACAGTATPMFFTYNYIGPMHVVTVDCEILPDPLHFCVVPTKEFKSQYYISVYALIFLPLFVTFVGFYTVVASYVWKQRIPISRRAHEQTSNATATSATNKTYTKANTKMSPRYVFQSNTTINTGSRSTLVTDSGSGTPLNRRREHCSDVPQRKSHAEPTVRTVHTKRKVRTFKVIMVLIVTCFIGRVPSWSFNVAQSDPDIRLDDMKWKDSHFSLLSQVTRAERKFGRNFRFDAIVKIRLSPSEKSRMQYACNLSSLQGLPTPTILLISETTIRSLSSVYL
ncbi:Pyroglutamylated RFamide peptide receptor [Zootermopsis nevadensis]|uniref:Pyroglutamylated RFamide peptide receptor n=1 Tax=Zootermopsis nevadensis TaxID=136037 RepID=A0A067RJ84_ZOONE|nr:Pyroglutamylated RFamide peptide receptor [Zootermopsis nevadensis]